EAGRGYCDYFASALAVMLRSTGVPARVVVGYVMHERNADGSFALREHDAHAWTEVYFQGYGWQRFDATPGGAAAFAPGEGQEPASGAFGSLPAPASPQLASPPVEPPSAEASPVATKPAAPGDSLSLPLLAFALLLAVALAATYALALRLREPRRAAFAAWLGGGGAARLFVRAPASGETAHEFAAATARRSPRAAGLQALAAAYTAARYGPRPTRLPAPSHLWRILAGTLAGLTVDRLRRRSKP
ncbi:MAG TPA: transglutaminase domain-containing protein, partial [Dehalococcoidia bacterium]|nr:transglutaminase domain-containing protein [Dehalococcoidia bacterium]